MTKQVDVAVVGAGIVGLANAWMAARRGLKVAVFERNRLADGASIRNFGMVWPVGQPPGDAYRTAVRSRELWMEMTAASGVWANPCGSLHVAYQADELAVMEEFAARAPELGVAAEILSPDAVVEKSPAVKRDGLLGALWSPTEVCVNPRTAIPGMAKWLVSSFGVEFHFNCPISLVESGRLRTAAGEDVEASRIVVCTGSDFAELFPKEFAGSGVRRCKLQMMRTGPQPAGWRIGPHLAAGLTLRHYSSFKICPSLQAYVDRVSREAPELDRYGIHVMASQNDRGDVVLGDSHEYDDEITPFDNVEIDALIERELARFLQLPNPKIVERWSGIYAKHPTKSIVEVSPCPGVAAMTATGGAGMTMSFGFAEQAWQRWCDGSAS